MSFLVGEELRCAGSLWASDFVWQGGREHLRKGSQGRAPPQWSLENCHGGGGEEGGRRGERRNIELESKRLVVGSTRFNLAIFF